MRMTHFLKLALLKMAVTKGGSIVSKFIITAIHRAVEDIVVKTCSVKVSANTIQVH